MTAEGVLVNRPREDGLRGGGGWTWAWGWERRQGASARVSTHLAAPARRGSEGR